MEAGVSRTASWPGLLVCRGRWTGNDLAKFAAAACPDWRNPGDLKATCASVSFIGDLTVFNVGGNKYRIAAFVHYRKQIVNIKKLGAHKEYDKWDL
jgi:mRNA-degrading endonuclease HigB of HigAB toxin-antitoxin module